MNNWQNWIVVLVLIACFGWVAFKIYTLIVKAKNNESPCSSCSTGCSMHNVHEKHLDETTCGNNENKSSGKVG